MGSSSAQRKRITFSEGKEGGRQSRNVPVFILRVELIISEESDPSRRTNLMSNAGILCALEVLARPSPHTHTHTHTHNPKFAETCVRGRLTGDKSSHSSSVMFCVCWLHACLVVPVVGGTLSQAEPVHWPDIYKLLCTPYNNTVAWYGNPYKCDPSARVDTNAKFSPMAPFCSHDTAHQGIDSITQG